MRPQRNVHHHFLTDGSRDRINGEQHIYLMRALSPDDHLAAVVGFILGLSRSANGDLALELSDVSVPQLLAEAQALAEPFAVTEAVTLLIDYDRTPAVVHGEHTALLWALMNLTCRVVKSTPAGGIVHLSAIALLDSVELRVTHSRGDRLYKSHSSLFEPVGPSLMTRDVEIARDLTRLMGGELLVRSTIAEATQYAMRFQAAGRSAQRALPAMAA
jgi:hypothetical protein